MYDQLTSWENLLRAHQRAAKGKRGHANVAAFEYRLEENLLALQYELQTQRYQPGAYNNFIIREPKRRLISAAPFRDRVVHHALCNLIAPIFERSFIADSYANRVGKGTHRALDQAQAFARRFPYVWQCDIRQFFPSLDHAILCQTLYRKISDERTRWLIDRILASGVGVLQEQYEMVYFPGDDLFAVNRPRGLPIGNLTSQFWANCYLNPFDHFVKRVLRCEGYLRYVDDLLFFGNSLHELWQYKLQVEERLAGFRLTIHASTHPKPGTEGISFLGFILYPARRRLKRRKGFFFWRKLRKRLALCIKEKASFEGVNASVLGWINHVRFANTIGLRKKVLGKL